ncbi:NAD(P)-dependent oxidoreductase [Granulicella sibirica]|uniref:Flavin reductase n=1 Tax=Granulicella sibirica TaxID=2479048 RepID=A0A4Q0T959_9BACT|nr:NAD(P)H-binding protein [Granulicella sibirica]RXH58141.1 Flavin reductase [Granulicella sibirica]
MKLIVFGATGRVGKLFIEKAIARGYEVTAFVRKKGSGRNLGTSEVVGDVKEFESVRRGMARGYDAVLVAIGEGALRSSTVMTKGVTNISNVAEETGVCRYVGVSGSAEIANQTWTGRLYTRILKLTPVGHAVRDHDGALHAFERSNLDWTLAGCNYLGDGPARGHYQTALTFSGVAKKIFPADVASFLLKEMTERRFVRKVVGIWY